MPRNILEIYKEYKIIPSLQMHMLRVAAVASIICDNFDEPLQKEDIITACLLHDMGNIIKSNFEFMPESLELKGLGYWQGVKNEYIDKYGKDEEVANVKIMQELNMSKYITSLVDYSSFSFICSNYGNNDINLLIVKYADMRVSPYGVVSFDERMDEVKTRYEFTSEEESREHQKMIFCGKKIEKEIFAKCKIKPEDITDEAVQLIILKLKDFVVK